MRKPQNLTNIRQYGKTFRVKFTLTKLQEDLPEQKEKKKGVRDKLLMLTYFFSNKSNGNKIHSVPDKSARQIKMQRLCKSRLN